MPDAITYFFPWLDAQTSTVKTCCTLRSFDGCKVPFWLLLQSWAGYKSWGTESGLSQRSLSACELIRFLTLTPSHSKYMECCKYGDMENTVIHAFFYTPDSQGCMSISVLGRYIAWGERHSWAGKGYLLDRHFFTLVTAVCWSLRLKLWGSELQPRFLVCGVHVGAAGHLGWGRALYLFVATKQGGTWAMKLSGLRALLDNDLYREWEKIFQIANILKLNYSSEKWWSERPHPCYTCRLHPAGDVPQTLHNWQICHKI